MRRFNLGSYMYIDPDSFQALEIFAVEQHPSLVKGVGRAKEGFSLLSLLDNTVSPTGRRMLREWMLRPLKDVAEISCRQDAIEFLLSPINGEHVDAIRKSLKCCKDARR